MLTINQNASLPPSENEDLAGADNNTDGELTRYVHFMLYDQGRLEIVRTEPLDSGADSRVERAARGFMQEGLVVSDGDSHSVAPAQCLRSALNDSQSAVYLVPEGRRDQMMDLDHAMRGLKRPGSRRVDDPSHPRKLRVLGDTRPRAKIPVNPRRLSEESSD